MGYRVMQSLVVLGVAVVLLAIAALLCSMACILYPGVRVLVVISEVTHWLVFGGAGAWSGLLITLMIASWCAQSNGPSQTWEAR